MHTQNDILMYHYKHLPELLDELASNIQDIITIAIAMHGDSSAFHIIFLGVSKGIYWGYNSEEGQTRFGNQCILTPIMEYICTLMCHSIRKCFMLN